jgi:SSS family solute:Na+ symporter
MNFHPMDWAIIGLMVIGLAWLTQVTRGYVRSVADFLAANRMAGRYLLTVATGIGGAVSIIAAWEMGYTAGLPPMWWGMMGIPVGLLIGLSGFVVYRLRQTRALTLAQFFEMRYSRRFRFFSGLLCWISGAINYGIFPAVSARFLIHFFGLPQTLTIVGMTVPMLAVVMALYLGFALYIALSGGQITIMIADFAQGIMVLLISVVLMFFLVFKFSWTDIADGLQMAETGKSMLNPFKTSAVRDFNVWYFLIGVFSGIYNVRAWQGSSGYSAAAKSPHEGKMAGILANWRGFALGLVMTLIPLAAYAVLHLPKYAHVADPILQHLNTIADPQIRTQMTVPVFLTHVLPIGFMGLFGAIILSAAISCDNTYMHAWGTIFVQDVILPLRKKPLSPRAHLLLLRLSIVCVGLFGFTFSLLFPMKEFIYMFFALTSAIYLGGAGAVIIGGLYWKRGTTAAAYAALSVGSALGFGGIVVQQMWKPRLVPFLLQHFPDNAWLPAHSEKFPVNGQVLYFYSILLAILCYVLVSLLGPRKVFDMDRLLHRGKYATTDDVQKASEVDTQIRRTFRQKFAYAAGLTSELTGSDRILYWVTFYWSMGWWLIFLVGTLVALTIGLSDNFWSTFWWFKVVGLGFVLGLVSTVWFTWGGLRDARQLIVDLRAIVRDDADDGRVTEPLGGEAADAKAAEKTKGG